mmetsp:Transcript_11174/g.24531  ORF Transcript_11174/g.24531 Transcript_11174/m.24531 type:complete len:120 (+) Transcript_11174:1004-1363(+)
MKRTGITPDIIDINSINYKVTGKYFDIKNKVQKNKMEIDQWTQCNLCQKWRRLPKGYNQKFFDKQGGFKCFMLRDVNCETAEENHEEFIPIEPFNNNQSKSEDQFSGVVVKQQYEMVDE